MAIRRQPYQRDTSPAPLRLTERDTRILETIYAFDGMMSLKQIDQLFFSGKGRSQPRARMRALFDHGYVRMPTSVTIHQVPLGQTIYWLDRKGAEVVAALRGETLTTFTWRKQPRFALLAHDLAVNEFRIAIHTAVRQSPHLDLGYWIPEGVFWSEPDKVAYQSVAGKQRQRWVKPDGFFMIEHQAKSEPLAFLLEIDMSTEDNPRFARQKVRPGIAYLHSEAYQQRFGLRYGRYLVVTTGQKRLHNLKAQSERAGGKGLFYFTTFAAITPQTVLTQPIWYLAGESQPRTIIP